MGSSDTVIQTPVIGATPGCWRSRYFATVCRNSAMESVPVWLPGNFTEDTQFREFQLHEVV